MSRITFNNDDFFYNPNKSVHSYYQICSYKDENKDLYGVRKIKFDENIKILSANVKYYPKKIINKFIEKNKNVNENKIKMYPYNNINMVPYPTMSELNESFSNLLNGNGNMSGFSTPNF